MFAKQAIGNIVFKSSALTFYDFNVNFLNMILKRPVGVIVFGLILIVTSLIQYHFLIPPAYSFYRMAHHEWPEWIIKIRFIGSHIFRLLGLVSGIGVLCLSNKFRQFLVWFSYYCIITLPLRHTYNAMLFFTEPIYNSHKYALMVSLQTFTWINVFLCWIMDGAFSLAAIYYFTRPKVIKNFK